MVVGLLAWLTWDVGTDIAVASQRAGLEGLHDQQWYAVQLLATLSAWLMDDAEAWSILEDSVFRTPRFRVDSEPWIAVHRAALETFALVALRPDDHKPAARRVRPGDLVVLHAREAPRVRIVLDVRSGSDGGKIVILEPDAPDRGSPTSDGEAFGVLPVALMRIDASPASARPFLWCSAYFSWLFKRASSGIAWREAAITMYAQCLETRFFPTCFAKMGLACRRGIS